MLGGETRAALHSLTCQLELGRGGSGMERWEQDWAGCVRQRVVQSVLEQGQNCLMLAREALDLERVLQTAACAASFA